MSRRADFKRAKSGIIFRDGHLVDRTEWESAHPSKAQRQAVVDEAIVAQMATMKDPYSCTRCGITHSKGKIHMAHKQYKES